MKPSKIANRLIFYFSAALLLFAVMVGGAFAALSGRRTMNLYRLELETKAETISHTMYGFLSGSSSSSSGHSQHGSSMHGSGYGAYLRYLNELAMADVWVVDANSKSITACSEHMGSIEYNELPPDGETIIDQALNGEKAFSESFSGFLGEPTLSVAVPIRQDDSSTVLGAVLVHTPVQGMSDAVWDSLKTMLGSILLALLLAVPTGILLSLKFTKPLNKMKITAKQLAQGDLTARNRISQSDEIGELAQVMDQMADRLREASLERDRLEQTRRDFISNISHELRTPVTVLRGSLEALADGVVTDPIQVKEYQAQMLTESKHLQRLVNDLLELSRLQNADFKMEEAPLELHQLVEDVARSMRQMAEPKNVKLEVREEEGDFSLAGDYGRLRQMLIIVTDNALKFSPPGETVLLSLERRQGRPAILAVDHGPGISEEHLPHIFDRFQRSVGTENPSGTGLGLPIAKQIASRHGIEVQVTSRPGHTEFLFLFPKN